jgi:hypothetical protein
MTHLCDFDFFVGRWRVAHRRLKARLAGCTEWETFGGTSEMRLLMDGRGTIDDNVIELPAGTYRAATLRSYDAATGLWAIWWLDGRMPHRIDPQPLVGRFDAQGVGTFYADDDFEGRPIRVRFIWSDIGADSCRWQQAFSADGGESWETNWIMDFTRVT